jgi:hypothetical protein
MSNAEVILKHLAPLIKQVGYDIRCYEHQEIIPIQGAIPPFIVEKFPDGCIAARITGPYFPDHGLLFIVPESFKETWAKRVCLALSAAFLAGMGKASESDALDSMRSLISKLADVEGMGGASARAMKAHLLAREIVSEVRSPGPDDEGNQQGKDEVANP